MRKINLCYFLFVGVLVSCTTFIIFVLYNTQSLNNE